MEIVVAFVALAVSFVMLERTIRRMLLALRTEIYQWFSRLDGRLDDMSARLDALEGHHRFAEDDDDDDWPPGDDDPTGN